MLYIYPYNNSYLTYVHTIVEGDTLWSLANLHYRSPDQWPTLWSYNDEITNPHWIYPGNKIVFSLGSIFDLPQVELVTNEDPQNLIPAGIDEPVNACGPDIHFNFKQHPGTFIIDGFLKDSNEVEVLGVVEKSPHNRSMLTDEDLVYINVEDKNDYPCGEVLTVFRKVRNRVGHPDDTFFRISDYGTIYKIVGEVVVSYTPEFGNYVTARIRDSWGEISRGDLVGSRMDVIIQSEVAIPTGNKTATIIERLDNEHNINTNRHLLFIDKGSSDGIKKGDTFYVVKRRDEFYRKQKYDPMLPATVIGRVMVVQVEANSAGVVITDSRQSIEIGDHISQNID